MKPDWRYLTCASVGFSNPRILDYHTWRARYGCSKNVGKDENGMLNTNKVVSLGRVKSYGSVTCIINCVGLGA